MELRHPCPPHLTQEPNSPLNGRPRRLPCTAVSPSSQTSGLLGSYSPSLSPKAECPIQVSDSDKKPQRFVGVQAEGGEKLSRWCQRAVIHSRCYQLSVCQEESRWRSFMSEDEVRQSDIVCAGCLCLCRGNSDTYTHTHLRLDETIWWRTIKRLNTTLVYNHLPD